MQDTRVIRIAVRAADLVPRARLKIIQDDLKTLPTDKYFQLRNEIVEKGFSFAIHVWDDGQDLCVLDGTQRIRTTDRMIADEGYVCDVYPVNFVEAGSLKEAVQKLLGGAGMYGEPNDEGLAALMRKFEINMIEIRNISLPTISLPKFQVKFFPMVTPQSQTKVEFMANDHPTEPTPDDVKEGPKNVCPRCGYGFN